ncbi:hypothetical protein R1flu_024338 [Riccia fluitans]|uniref:Uncharacterized protein n=1 Tax=Riccia fluitans TaxID=41844 RepID=A0ABD1XXI2_9MARC
MDSAGGLVIGGRAWIQNRREVAEKSSGRETSVSVVSWLWKGGAKLHMDTGRSASTSRTPSPPFSNSRALSPLPQPRSVPDLHGRARRKAELNRLTQEIRLLEEEMQMLATLPPASEHLNQNASVALEEDSGAMTISFFNLGSRQHMKESLTYKGQPLFREPSPSNNLSPETRETSPALRIAY